MCTKFEPATFYRQPSTSSIPPFYLLSFSHTHARTHPRNHTHTPTHPPTPPHTHPHTHTHTHTHTHFWQYSFANITPMKHGVNTKINSCKKSYFFVFRRLQNNAYFFISYTFYKPQQAEIWSNKYQVSKGVKRTIKTYWVRNITVMKFINIYMLLMKSSAYSPTPQPSSIDNPPFIWISSRFLQKKSWRPPPPPPPPPFLWSSVAIKLLSK